VAGLVALVCVKPSDQVKVHGAVPVSVADRVVGLPLQIVALPLTFAVGSGLTVRVAVLVEVDRAASVTVAV
jgi:hypothetical protein